jgi:carboxypeptidase C (cathepsin A)
MRSVGVADWLRSRRTAFNGVILVSVFVDATTAITLPGNDLAYQLFVPTYAAIAWYHKMIPNAPADLATLADEARRFAAGEYATALAKGDKLPTPERQVVIAKLSRLTGLSADYLDKANLRVAEVSSRKSSGASIARRSVASTPASRDRPSACSPRKPNTTRRRPRSAPPSPPPSSATTTTS